MNIIKYPSESEWHKLVERPALDVSALFDTVQNVLNEVRKEGDKADIRYGEQFDKIDPTGFQLVVSSEAIDAAEQQITPALRIATHPAV